MRIGHTRRRERRTARPSVTEWRTGRASWSRAADHSDLLLNHRGRRLPPRAVDQLIDELATAPDIPRLDTTRHFTPPSSKTTRIGRPHRRQSARGHSRALDAAGAITATRGNPGV
ncbi:hypothetical protein [Actinomadura algeriensis]|uniref:Uncharacterized protein n=1 Tax=Actinomadura algeriensis TaxID=1679523 RepID=A0ABR9K0M0_9ACTN|nr:hypothetical protein [Actinomadura algeriensis]MBE1536379.1 hypothetical protein [Actinomadura algeriensis]